MRTEMEWPASFPTFSADEVSDSLKMTGKSAAYMENHLFRIEMPRLGWILNAQKYHIEARHEDQWSSDREYVNISHKSICLYIPSSDQASLEVQQM